VDQIDYRRGLGYILQVMMKKNRIRMILVLDSRLFQENFNQYFLLGRFNNDYFTEVYSDVPSLRVLEIKGSEPDDAIHH
jgi:hypothetical protein